jgi:hypothetical protein
MKYRNGMAREQKPAAWAGRLFAHPCYYHEISAFKIRIFYEKINMKYQR